MIEYNCRVCGLNIYPDKFWYNGHPMYIICPCCGCESGNEDSTIASIKYYRNNWISKGAKWFNSKEKPKKWSMEEQLEKVPIEFK